MSRPKQPGAPAGQQHQSSKQQHSSSSSSSKQQQDTHAARHSRGRRLPLVPLLLLAFLLLAAIERALLPVAAAAVEVTANAASSEAAAAGTPLQLAIVNHVPWHLEVVAGAMHILKQLTSAHVTVYLPTNVLKANWYGFSSWLGGHDGFLWRDTQDYNGTETYDLVWFITPERHGPWVHKLASQMKPRVGLYYVHNGHLPDAEMQALQNLAGKVPLLTLSTHVAQNITGRTGAGAVPPEWILPIWPFAPDNPTCSLQDIQAGKSCVQGFSIQGMLDPTRRNYSSMWRQINAHRNSEGAQSLRNFKLNILGKPMHGFTVPSEVKDLVAIYKNVPYFSFYSLVYHSYALAPMLASPLYYQCKFTSTLLTSLITGVPLIADNRFLAAYSMVGRDAVYYQADGQDELDVMFGITRMAPEEVWKPRAAILALREKLNERALKLVLGWLADNDLVPDAHSKVGKKQKVQA